MLTMRAKPSGWPRRWRGWGDVARAPVSVLSCGASRMACTHYGCAFYPLPVACPVPLVLATTVPGVPEIFASLQGEGPSAGMPVAFLRLSRCNLACVWCDTPYTWHFTGDDRPHNYGRTWDRKFNQVTFEIAEVAEIIAELGQRRLVITGGEPLLQGADLAELLELLPEIRVEIETNGTVMPHEDLDYRVDQYNVSPKLAHSGNPAALALRPALIDHWAAEPRATFKFVISSPDDLAEVRDLAEAHQIDPEKIILMPEGIESEALREKIEWLAPLCMESGYRLGDRLHIHLFGDTRGT